MGKLYDGLVEYFNNTPQEKIDKDFDEIHKKYGHIGLDVEEYIKYAEDINNDIDKKYQFYLSICNIKNPMTRSEFIDAVREGKTYAFPTKKEGVLRYYKCGDLE